MAAKKQQTSGTVPADKSATPFATKDGRPADPGTAPRGFDYLRTGGGGSDAQRAERVPGRDFTKEATSQVPAPFVEDPMASPRPQTPGTPRDRVDAASIAAGGVTPAATPGAARAAARIVDAGPTPAKLPFKGLK